MQTYIDLDFADGNYRFSLSLARLNAVQEKCGPIFAVFNRIAQGACSYEDALEIVREALIGGARGEVSGKEIPVTPAKANQLVRDYIEEAPLYEVMNIARNVLAVRMFGIDEKAEEKPAEKPDEETEKKSPKVTTKKATKTP